ncbi:pyridoxal phosphate-dependent decarboxylase family protein, partial [Streptomyces sp. NPDC086023]|uniref:pyridoxal phosphate-dependent decarboxylase family protein n=1 Tax=Streptomyces sp. NPDC086023 TaxID=3365746 RepID=UPI0037CEB8DC
MGENALMDLERGTIRTLADLAGLPASTGGVLTSGGSMANLLALATARTWFLTRRGTDDGPAYDRDHARLTLYYNTQAHMSVAKAAACIGIPAHHLRPIPSDTQHRLDPAALRAAVTADQAAGLLPFCTVATLGTTATGAVDPLEPVTALCLSTGMWHHADGAWGGLSAMAPALAHLYQGVADVGSMTVDPHKTLSMPVGCGALLVTDPDHLHTAFAHRASYLTPGEPNTLPWLSHSTIELTRPGTRALALWATLHHLGRDGVTALLQHYLNLADRLRHKITANPRLELVAGGPWPVACFRLTTCPKRSGGLRPEGPALAGQSPAPLSTAKRLTAPERSGGARRRRRARLSRAVPAANRRKHRPEGPPAGGFPYQALRACPKRSGGLRPEGPALAGQSPAPLSAAKRLTAPKRSGGARLRRSLGRAQRGRSLLRAQREGEIG